MVVVVGLVNLKECDGLPLLDPCIAVILAFVGSVISGIYKLVPVIESFVITAVWFAIAKSYLIWQFPLSTGCHLTMGMLSSYENESIVTSNGKSESQRN